MSAVADTSPGSRWSGLRAMVAALLLLALVPDHGYAQGPFGEASARRPPILVAGARGLRFGRIFRGTPSTVSPNSNRAAQFVIIGINAQIQITFLLPTGLVSRAGDILPLEFGPGDGLMFRLRGFRRQAFDPTVPLTLDLGIFDIVRLRLGGTAQPGATQPLGRYTGTLTVMVADLGT